MTDTGRTPGNLKPGTFVPPPKMDSDREFMAALAACDNTKEGIERWNMLVFGARVCEDGVTRSLHDGQSSFIQDAKAQVNLLSPGNAWGKTEYVARDAVWSCWRKDGLEFQAPQDWITADYRALIASYEYGIAGESFQRLMQLYKSGGNFSRLISKVWEAEGAQKILFKNGSILDFGSLKDNGRHVEATRRNKIYVDEVGQIPDFETCYNDVLYARTMAVNGRINLIGTPKPTTDPFVYHIFEMGRDGADPMYFAREGDTLRDNQFITEREKARIRKNPKFYNHDGSLTTLGKQVIQGKFILAGGLFFNRLRVARMFTGTESQPYFGPYDDPEKRKKWMASRSYLVAWDLGGRKKKSDATVCHVWDVTQPPFYCVEVRSLSGLDADWQEKYAQIKETYETYKPPYVLIDVTGSTKDSIAEELENRGVPVEGVQFGGAQGGKKYNMLRSLQLAMEMECKQEVTGEDGLIRYLPSTGMIRYPSTDIEPDLAKVKKQFDFYVLKDEKLTQDHVMAAAMLAHEALQSVVPDYDPDWQS